MKSTHTYAASVIGSPDRALGLRGGTITLDATRSPHVEGRLTLSIPDAAILGLLDPRDRKRIRIEATAVFAFGTQSRTFDLGIRERTVQHRESVMTLTLASDEAMLADCAPLADDTTPYLYQASIRSLVDYVLGLAIPGASLSPGGSDPTIHALIDSVNVVRNPRARNDLGDWSSPQSIARIDHSGPEGSPTYVTVTSTSVEQLIVSYSAEGVPIREGTSYRVSVAQNTAAGTSVGFDGLVLDADDNILLDLIETPQVATSGWFRSATQFVAPAGAAKLQLRSFTTTTVPAGQALHTSAWRVSEATDDPTDIEYFDGDTVDTSEFDYAYVEETSVRTALLDRASDLLTWRAGVSALAFLTPITQALGLRLVCDETRHWTLRDASYVASGSIAIRHGVNLIDGDDTISREDTETFDAAVVRYTWRDLTGTQRERIESFALVDPPTQVRLLERSTPYPGPGFAEYAVRRVQGRGRQVTVTAVANWSAKAEQPSEYTLLGAPTQLGMTSRIVFDLDRDEMTVTSSTVDTITDAIDLLTGVIDDLTGTISSL